ncbi:MAG: oligosaccharide flippase family protein [Tannerellaceae bacterium]|nr:oligosaccharide flippase family protein [Tannerellaceae bacterium]
MKTFFSSEIRKNTFRLLSANAISQLIGLAVYPLVTRLYSPGEFGLYNIFITLCGILFILSTGRYEYAIVLPKSHKDAAALAVVCFRVACWFTLLLFFISIVFYSQILAILHLEELDRLIYLIPILVFINALGLIGMYWCNRFKNFGAVGRYWMSQNSVNSTMKIIFGFLKYTLFGLVWSFFAGVVAGTVSFLFAGKYRKNFRLWRNIRKEHVKQMACHYSNYPKYNLPHAFINTLSAGLPVFLFGHFFGNELVGFYGLAILISFRPINLLTTSFYQVLYQRMAEQYNRKESIYLLFKKFCLHAFSVLIPCFILIYFISGPVVKYFFGFEWLEAATILNILLPWLLFCFITGIFEFIPALFFQQKKAFMIEILYGTGRLLAILLGIYMQDYYISLFAYSMVGAGFKLFQLGWFRHLIISYEHKF